MTYDAPLDTQTEPSAVQLTRIEGTINLIKYQNENMSKDMTHVKVDVEKLKTDVHTLQLEAVARDKLAGTVASTLKDADAALIVKNDQKWTPLTRLVLIVTAVLYITSLYFLLHK